MDSCNTKLQTSSNSGVHHHLSVINEKVLFLLVLLWEIQQNYDLTPFEKRDKLRNIYPNKAELSDGINSILRTTRMIKVNLDKLNVRYNEINSMIS